MAAVIDHRFYDNDLCLYETTASMYINKAKKWVDGLFYISPEGIYFECSESQRSVAEFCGISFDFKEINLVQKESSSYIFPSVAVYVGKEKYWFGSFPSRESTFNMLEHFWKENLFLSKKSESRPRRNSSEETILGKELLKIVYDSEKVLNSSAQSLQRQGVQLDDVLMTVENIHGDLAVADSRLSTLESWLGKLSASPSCNLQKNPASKKFFMQYPIVYCRKEVSGTKERNYQGLLRIDPETLSIIDEKEIVVHQFKKCDISAIYIISPWEMKIEKRMFGERDTCFSITTAQLIVALTQLKRHYGNVLEMEEARPSSPRKIRPRALHTSKERCDAACSVITGNDVSSVYAEKRQALVSDDEVRELHEMIGNMKSLAIEITREQDQQLQKIDHLIESVDQADITVQEDIKRMRRLL